MRLERGSQLQGEKIAISVRNPVLGLILAILDKNTALRAPITPNSGMGNPNLRTESLFTSIYMLTGDQKSEGNLHNVAKKSHIWDPCCKLAFWIIFFNFTPFIAQFCVFSIKNYQFLTFALQN
jgi:hypothetical protein